MSPPIHSTAHTPVHPAWVRAIEKAGPNARIISGVLVGATVISAVIYGTQQYISGPPPASTQADWIEANKKYRKFQKMDPIFGDSVSKPW